MPSFSAILLFHKCYNTSTAYSDPERLWSLLHQLAGISRHADLSEWTLPSWLVEPAPCLWAPILTTNSPIASTTDTRLGCLSFSRLSSPPNSTRPRSSNAGYRPIWVSHRLGMITFICLKIKFSIFALLSIFKLINYFNSFFHDVHCDSHELKKLEK